MAGAEQGSPPVDVSMDEIVALCKRRGFVFPSSEIYGGLGSTYDYGHYGVLLKNNVKAEWWRAMLQERDDIVALDSAILQHPRVWEASGHLAGFTDPLVDCKACGQRFRADHLDQVQCPRKKPPFGIAQIGKSFRNEITPGNFIFRTREFEQMEMEYFVPPDRAQEFYELWKAERRRWYEDLGLRPDHLRLREHDPDELSHYSSGTADVEYLFPIGWSE